MKIYYYKNSIILCRDVQLVSPALYQCFDNLQIVLEDLLITVDLHLIL